MPSCSQMAGIRPGWATGSDKETFNQPELHARRPPVVAVQLLPGVQEVGHEHEVADQNRPGRAPAGLSSMLSKISWGLS